MGKQKKSPLKVVPLNLMRDQPVPLIAAPTNSNTYRPSPIHYFTTNMVDYNAFDNNWNEDFIVTEVKNKVWLEINPYDGTPIDFDCKIDITLSIKHISFPEETETIESHTLRVNYKKDAHEEFNQIDLLELSGGQKVVVTITGIELNGLSANQTQRLSNKVFLKAQTIDTRYYKKSVFTRVDCNTVSIANNTNTSEVSLIWDPLPFAEEYDVEWVYDDTYHNEPTTTSSNILEPFNGSFSALQKDFFNNATRVTTKNNSLQIPLINELSDYRFRIRAVGKQGQNWEHRYEHDWSCENEIVETILPHENDELNYQTIATYAEDAKYKIVNEYFDGRMASRQKVTALQSQMRGHHYALVQESIYDGIGRKAIEVLPGPKQGGSLEFYEGFSINNAGEAYSHLDFDTGQSCPTNPAPMGTQSGASHYYSSDFYQSLSPQDQSSELALIPDASQYPFSQTVFMNDNTNRPIAQGGVGIDHKIGSGHETLISYVNPTQSELDRLFGTEVGYAKYYKKVVAEDPNGQVSFAYQDLKGNTIATSLWGKVSNLDSLISYKSVILEDDLTVLTKKDEDKYQISTEHIFFVPESNKQYEYTYDAIAAQFRDLTCTTSDICYDCVYDAEVAIINTDCNDTLYYETAIIGDENNLNQICEGFSWTSNISNVTLNKGNHIAKVALSVNENVADIYVDDYFADPNNQCVQHLVDFEEYYLGLIPDLPCDFDCSLRDEEVELLEARIERTKSLMSSTNGVTIEQAQEFRSQILHFQAQIDTWNEICSDGLNFCEQARERMIADLSPFGQYARLEFDDGAYTTDDTLSIFHEEFGIDVFGGSFTFPYTNPDGSISNIDTTGIGLSGFINTYWQDEWAEQFLEFHPEYCYLEMCNYDSADFDAELLDVTTAADAIALGYISANGMTSNPIILQEDLSNSDDIADPQFQAGGLLESLTNEMEEEMENFFSSYPSLLNMPDMSIYELAVYSTCQSIQSQASATPPTATAIPNCTTTIGVDYSDPIIADQVWTSYKGLYLSLKQKYEYQYMKNYALDNLCFNGCIGLDLNGFTFDIDTYGPQPCTSTAAYQYKNKQKVFPGPSDIPGMDNIPDAYDYENLEDIINQITDNITDILVDTIGCGLTGPFPPFVIDGEEGGAVSGNGETCIEYDCLDEIGPFLNQLIPSSSTAGETEFLTDQIVNVPACFGGSPFLQYSYIDAFKPVTNVYNDKHVFQATLGSAASDPNMCTILFTFFALDDVPLPPSEIDDYFEEISTFNSFEIDANYIDQYGESNHFIGTAISTYDNKTTKVGVRGYVTCAQLGRCCNDGVEAGIEACFNIPNVDNPTSTNEELWIGESNPYFDPYWILNPCDTENTEYPEMPDYICTNDTFALCCPPDTIIGGEFPPDTACYQERIDIALQNASVQYEQYLEDKKKEIKEAYMTQCLEVIQTFEVVHESGEHHFVLSYYDQSGNLTRTVPPNGTYDYEADQDKTFSMQSQLDAVTQARTNGQELTPDYLQWDTRYTYNSLNQITTQNLPDHGDPGTGNNVNPRNGETRFIYDELGRLSYSQNPVQIDENKYSYTVYDDLGRIVESGQINTPSSNYFSQESFFPSVSSGGPPPLPGGGSSPLPWNPGSGLSLSSSVSKEQITHTYYDEPPRQAFEYSMPNHTMDNLRSRVAYAEYYDTEAQLDASNGGVSGSYYSYDELGNVKALGQRLSGAFFKTMEYEYDLISGNVNKVIYQRDEEDQFLHRYAYDADNRITQAETSTDGCIWDKEAKYFYYPHGPLARVEIGNEEIQGQDYIYTIHGWIKGVNSAGLLPQYDAGKDGLSGSQNSTFALDEVGYMLNYYNGDYASISGSQDFEPAYNGQSPDLYNGNIRNMTTSIGHFIRENSQYGYVSNDYSYDQLNRIKEMRPWDAYDPSTNLWDPNDPRSSNWDNKPYFTKYSYDGNGNIFSLQRNGAASQVAMDQLTYAYKSKNNRLNAVTDAVNRNNYPLNPNDPNPIYDIDSRPIFNYIYDKLGNLTRDKAEGLQMDWNVQGKVRHITDTNGLPNVGGNPNPNNDRHIDMVYDPLGNRIAKVVDGEATYYVRDAQGNVMSTYHESNVPMRYMPEETAGTPPISLPTNGPINGRLANRIGNLQLPTVPKEKTLKWASAYIYGSDRIGEYQANKTIGGPRKGDGSTEIEFIPYNGTTTSPATTPQVLTPAEMDILTGFFNQESGLFNLPIFSSDNAPQQASLRYAKAKTNFIRGDRQYELTNHLGNVLATVADRKAISSSVGLALSGAEGEVLTANDYYPGGMLMPSRNYNYNDFYRYKHQSQESDDEIAGNGSNYFYKYRMSDSRLNRFWSVDPLTYGYQEISPYSFSENILINSIEREGLEREFIISTLKDFESEVDKYWGEAKKNKYVNEAWVRLKQAEKIADFSQHKKAKYIITSIEDIVMTLEGEAAAMALEVAGLSSRVAGFFVYFMMDPISMGAGDTFLYVDENGNVQDRRKLPFLYSPVTTVQTQNAVDSKPAKKEVKKIKYAQATLVTEIRVAEPMLLKGPKMERFDDLGGVTARNQKIESIQKPKESIGEKIKFAFFSAKRKVGKLFKRNKPHRRKPNNKSKSKSWNKKRN